MLTAEIAAAGKQAHQLSSQFVHLHTHSEFSLLDGAARIFVAPPEEKGPGKDSDDADRRPGLIDGAKELGMSALALTDHGAMYGIIDFYQAALSVGIKPVIGCEVYVAANSRFDRVSNKEETPSHLLLLAADNEGYRNLMTVVSRGFLEGFYYKPRVDRGLLAEYSKGLIATSACVKGEIATLLAGSNAKAAAEVAKGYEKIFGEGNFFLEIQNQGLEEQKAVNQALAELSQESGIPLVATNDVHYVRKEDSIAQDVLLCIQTAATLEQDDRLKFTGSEFYLKSEEEMARALPEYPDAIARTAEIAARCNVEIELGKTYLPHYETPNGESLDAFLESLCEAGVRQRYGRATPEVRARLAEELAVIEKTGFSGYFLVVWDFIEFAKQSGIKVGPGRGSAAGSIVSYVLGITDLDPLEHGLLFERFLNPERISMPDIDIDFDDEKRDQVIAYVRRKYGEDKVAQIITFGTMKARAATRDAGRVLGYPYGVVDRVAKQITANTIKEALQQNPELAGMYSADEDARKILDTAKALEGLARQDSIHAAGVVISRDSLTNFTPIQRKGDTETVTQYHMGAIEKIGLLKMDFLGLRTLTVIDNAVKIVKRIHDVDVDVDKLAMDDAETFELLKRGDTTGIFQLESSGMRSLLKELQPTAFSDIVACLALYRPGPIESGMIDDFVARKHGRRSVEYPHPALEPILRETHGTMVYQEQCMQIAQALAGFSVGEADDLRKAIGKKIKEKMEEIKHKFISGAVASGVSRKLAVKIWNDIDKFGGYGFNKSHSAAYAMISYQTAYLKAHYPVEFMAALLTSVSGNKDKVVPYVNECEQMEIKVLPPDVNESFRDFTAVGRSIRFGLAAIRNLGESVIETIIAERSSRGEFKSIYDFCERVDLGVINKRAVESMIKAGAFDFTSATRKHLLDIYETACDAGAKKQRDRDAGQTTIFDLADQKDAVDFEHLAPPTGGEELPKSELLSYEKEMLGLYVSDHPLEEIQDALVAQTKFTIAKFTQERDGTVGWIGGIITKVKRLTTKKGELMAAIQLEDLTASMEIVVFPGVYQECRELIADDKIVRVKAKLDRKEEETKGLAQEIEELSSEVKGPQSLNIRVNPGHLHNGLSNRLKQVLASYPGRSNVLLHVEDGAETQVFRLPNDYRVRASDPLLADLKGIVDESGVWLEG